MATTKVTITLDADQLASIRRLVSSGKARNTSNFIRHAVAVSLADVAGWGAVLGQALERTGGPLTPAERAWADGVLGAGGRPSRKRKGA